MPLVTGQFSYVIRRHYGIVSVVLAANVWDERTVTPFCFKKFTGVPADSAGMGGFGRGFEGTLNVWVFLL